MDGLYLILRNPIELPYNFAREKCRKLGANLLSIEDLKYFEPDKRAIDSNFEPLFDLIPG